MNRGKKSGERAASHVWSLGRSLLAAIAINGAIVAAPFVSGSAVAQQARAFNIPAQPLADALVQFGYQSGLQVVADGGLTASVRSPGVTGTLPPAEALARLLAGTGLVYRFTNATTVALERPGASGAPGALHLDPVQVQGYSVPSQAMIDNIPPPYAGGQVAKGGQLGLLGNRDVMDTPFNQTNFTAEKVQNQQAKTIRDVLIDDPSVRAYFPDGGAGTDTVRIRGLPVGSASTAYGGLYGVLPTSSIMAELADRVEVLKGPAAMIYGMPPGGSVGGTINLVPKRAPDAGLTQLTAGYVSAGQVSGHADVARRFGDEKQFGVRFNGVARAGQTEVSGNSDERYLGVLGLDYRGERVRLSADLGYQYRYIGGLIPYLGVNPGVQLPYAPNARQNFGQPWNYQSGKDLFGVMRAEVDITEKITAYATIGAHDYRAQRLAGGTNITALNFNGNATTSSSTFSQYQTYQTGEAGVRALVNTGPIDHEFAFSATGFQQETGAVTVTGAAYNTNIYNPNIIARPNIPIGAANKTSFETLSSLAFADTLSAANKRIQLTVGGRLQRVTATNYNPTTGASTDSYDQSALTPAVALIFKPWENVSLYGNFIQGLRQGVVVGSTFANAGEVFPPFKSTQFEVGAKVDWGRFTTTLSLFQITQPSTITDVASNTLVLAGEQRNQGLEFNVFGEPMEGVRLLGGFMLLDAVLTKTQGGLTDGWTAPFSPNFQLNIAGEWDTPFVRGLTLTARAVYTSSQYIDTTSPRRSLPDWTRLDIGARYALDVVRSPTGKPIVARFSVENLLDANYWETGSAATTLSLGAPRTFRLSLTADF